MQAVNDKVGYAPYENPSLTVYQNKLIAERVIFIENIPVNAEQKSLLKKFGKLGKIEKCWSI